MHRDEILLAGISVRTGYDQEMTDSRIGPTVMKYFHQGIPDRIPHRKNPGVTYCCYTDYESDFRGAYTYFIGEEVTEPTDEFETFLIPAQDYKKFTFGPGPMPDVVINGRKEIWQEDLNRSYTTDFELYDERAKDHSNVVLDIFIGIEA